MRMSCNGCRVLRKGCSESCSIRPCLQWIKTPESQSNATVFLAKFYGRAGLMNLINAGPHHLRPAIFRSMLYEACGRIVNPIYGSVGLLWSGNWQLCQNAVEAVLKGAPITPIASETAVNNNGPPLKLPYDIRHISKDENNSTKPSDLHRVRTRCRFKRSGNKKTKEAKPNPVCSGSGKANGSTSHESSLSHQSEAAAVAAANLECESREIESLQSTEMAEAEDSGMAKEEEGEIELELTLGFSSSFATAHDHHIRKETKAVYLLDDAGECKMKLGLH
ncbi:LOB domain-containing protein 41 [Capsicum annuum]|uniref:LOB domain-containing protein 41 n=1 Tax=Capsicum annuum TaxID=4072 RepID=A0A1U8FPS6_CAPAN|nr:LOB domain-containing protein 41 [Capsicum annuum]KAF3679490.1 LOB domain-containing protein 41 [Capsicum annuum]PHT91384.1 LOB domain-containing protein 41 [Capsicum annuum]